MTKQKGRRLFISDLKGASNMSTNFPPPFDQDKLSTDCMKKKLENSTKNLYTSLNNTINKGANSSKLIH